MVWAKYLLERSNHVRHVDSVRIAVVVQYRYLRTVTLIHRHFIILTLLYSSGTLHSALRSCLTASLFDLFADQTNLSDRLWQNSLKVTQFSAECTRLRYTYSC